MVEDDHAIGRALRRVVRSYGEMSLATTASEARGLLSRPGMWSAFVLDVGLPDGSGLDLLADARETFPATPALVLTGRTEAASINAAYDLNADYVVKPIEEARVRHFLDVAIQSKPLAARPARARPAANKSLAADPLQRCIEHLRLLLSQPADPMTRHAIGAAIADIKARPSEYGARAVSTAATALGEDVPTFYRYAGVAERWSVDELGALLARKGSDGRSLTWSHLVVLAAVPSASVRERLLERALAEGLSVRELTVLAEHCAAAASTTLDERGLRTAVLERDLAALEQRRVRCRRELDAARTTGLAEPAADRQAQSSRR